MLSGADTSFSTSTPGSIARAACRLRTNSPAAINNSSDSATSPTTSTRLRSRRERRSPPGVSEFFSPGTSPGRDAWRAGATPNRTPVRDESSSENSSTRRSIEKSTLSGSAPGGGAPAAKAWSAPHATATPATPPISDSNTLSVSSCWTMRPRLAPSASRTASSRRRDAALDSSRFAMLAHAISRTAPTTPPSRSATDRIWSRGPALPSSIGSMAIFGGVEPGFIRVRTYSAATGSSSARA